MSGIICTLQFRTPGAQLPDIQNGLVWLGPPVAYVATNPAQSTVDKWIFPIQYYICQADQQAGHPSIDVSSFVYPDGITPVYTSFEIPYEGGSDPLYAAKAQLQTWWPQGTIVP